MASPVTFPPGLARLPMRPISTTSLLPTMTIGTVFVTLAAASVAPQRQQNVHHRAHEFLGKLRQRLDIARAFVLEHDVTPGRIAEFAQSIDELPRVRGWIEGRDDRVEDPQPHNMTGR